MVDVHSANHRSFLHIRHIVDDPGNAADLGTDLRDELADDDTQVPTVVDRAC